MISKKFAEAVVKKRVTVIIVCLMLTAYFGWEFFPAKNVRFDFSFRRLFRYEWEEGRTLIRFKEMFMDDALTIAVLFCGQESKPLSAFSPASLLAVRRIETWLKERKELESAQTFSPLSATNLFSTRIQPNYIDKALDELLRCGEVDQLQKQWANSQNASPVSSCIVKFREAVQELLEHSLYRGKLFSDTGDIVAILSVFKKKYVHPKSRQKLIDELQFKIQKENHVLAQYNAGTVKLIGIPVVSQQYESTSKRDLRRLLPIIIVVMLALLYLVFRTATETILPLVVVGFGAIWGIGFMQKSGVPLDIINHVVPVVILVVGIADAVHIIARYFEEVSLTKDRKEAVKRTLARLSVACFLTSSTTAVGFASLSTAKIPSIVSFGIYTAAAVMLTYVVNITLLPAVLTYFGSLRPARWMTPKQGQTRFTLLHKALKRLASFTQDHASLVIAVTLVACALMVASALFLLRVNSRLLEELPSDTQLYKATKLAESKLSPVIPYDILIEGKRRTRQPCSTDLDCRNAMCGEQDELCSVSCLHFDPVEYVFSPIRDGLELAAGTEAVEFVNRIEEAITSHYEQEGGVCAYTVIDPRLLEAIDYIKNKVLNSHAGRQAVGRVDTLADVVKEMNRAMSTDKNKWEIPKSRQAVAQLLLPLESTSGNLLDHYVTTHKDALRVTLFLKDKGSELWFRVRAMLEKLLAEKIDKSPVLSSRYSWKITGPMTYVEDALSFMIHDMLLSLLSAFVVIFFLVVFLFRSIRVGLAAIIPNIFPLLCTFALMSLAGVELRLATLVIFSISLGIAVNDTIHLLTRFREEVLAGNALDTALETSLLRTGRAMIMTTIVLAIGFAVDLVSDFKAAQQFGYLSGFTLLCALVGDLVVLPACIKVYRLDRAFVKHTSMPTG